METKNIEVTGKLFGKSVKVNIDSWGTCPACGAGEIYEKSEKVLGCTNYRCQFVVFQEFSGKKLNNQELFEIVQLGATKNPVQGLTAKSGRIYDSRIMFDKKSLRVKLYREQVPAEKKQSQGGEEESEE